jgi:hypothetical protein
MHNSPLYLDDEMHDDIHAVSIDVVSCNKSQDLAFVILLQVLPSSQDYLSRHVICAIVTLVKLRLHGIDVFHIETFPL